MKISIESVRNYFINLRERAPMNLMIPLIVFMLGWAIAFRNKVSN